MKKRTTIVLAVIAAVMLGYILFFDRGRVTSGELEGREGRFLTRFVRGRATEVEVDHGERSFTLVRVREEEGELGEWRMTEPMEVLADDDTVGTLLGLLEWSGARRELTGLSAADLESFGLSDPALRVRVKVGAETITLAFGAEVPSGGRYAQLDDPTSAYVVGKDIYEGFDKEPFHYRTKELFPDVALARADRFTVTRDGRAHVFVRRDGRFFRDGEPPELVDAKKLRDALQKFSGLLAARYKTDEPEGEPSMRLEVFRAAGGPRPEKRGFLEVFGDCEGHEGERLVKNHDGAVACVPIVDLETFELGDDVWDERQLTRLADDSIRGIEIKAGGQALTVRDGEDGLEYRVGSTSGRANPEAVADWLAALREVRVSEVRDALASEGLFSEDAPEILLSTEGHSETLRLGRSEADGVWIRRLPETRAVKVPADVARLFEPSPLHWKPRVVIAETALSLERIRLAHGTRVESVSLGDDEGWTVQLGERILPADRATIRQLADRIAGLRAEEFEVREVRGEPRAAVTFVFGGTPPSDPSDGHDHGEGHDHAPAPASERSYELVLLGTAPQGGAYAYIDDRATGVFVVSDELSELLTSSMVSRDLFTRPLPSRFQWIPERGEGWGFDSDEDGELSALDGSAIEQALASSLPRHLLTRRAQSASNDSASVATKLGRLQITRDGVQLSAEFFEHASDTTIIARVSGVDVELYFEPLKSPHLRPALPDTAQSAPSSPEAPPQPAD